MPDRRIAFGDYWRLLRNNKNYRLLWYAQVVSELGDWFYAVTIYSLLLELTGRAESVAIAFVLQVLPQFFAAPAAGVINDRLKRRNVMIFADWGRSLVVLAMLFVQGRGDIPLLYVLLVLETLLWALFEPAHTAVVPNITSGDEILVGNALASTTWSFNFAFGFALGGIAAAFLGREAIYIVNSLSFIASALLIRRMQFEEPHAEAHAAFKLRDLFDFHPHLEGWRYVRRNPRIQATMFVKAGMGLIGANWVLLPLMGRALSPFSGYGFSSSQSQTLGISLLMGCRGVGAIVGPLAGNYIAGSDSGRLRVGILYGFMLASLGYFLLSVAPNVWAAAACVIIAHSGSAIIWVFSTTLLQLMTDDRFRGRVFSAEFGVSVVTMSISSGTSGVLIDHGWRPSSAALLVGATLLVPAALWWRHLRKPSLW